MTDAERKCPERWDQAQLLAYIEGDLDRTARAEMEAHLQTCKVCSSKLEHLRQVDSLLKDHAEVFHPDEADLYHFVASGEDVDGKIASHLESCPNCVEDVELLKEMLRIGPEVPDDVPAMPRELFHRIERIHPGRGSDGMFSGLYTWVAKLVTRPVRLPVLALGTAAAVLVLAIVSIPLWQTFKEISHPALSTAVQEPQSSGPGKADESGLERPEMDHIQTRPLEAPVEAKKEVLPGERVAPSPAPFQRFGADKETDKWEEQRQGPIRTEPDLALQEEKPVQGEKQKSYSTGARDVRAPQTMRSGRESRPTAPPAVAPERKPAAKPAHSVSSGEAAPRSPDSSADFADFRIPVTLRIVDSSGRRIPWLKFDVPTDLASRYRFLEPAESEETPSTGAIAPGKTPILALKDRGEEQKLITIQVRKRGEFFDLVGKLFQAGSSRESKTLEAVNVAEKDLQDKIRVLVSSLLDAK